MQKYLKRFPDYKLVFGGEYEDTQNQLNALFRAFGLAALPVLDQTLSCYGFYLDAQG